MLTGNTVLAYKTLWRSHSWRAVYTDLDQLNPYSNAGRRNTLSEPKKRLNATEWQKQSRQPIIRQYSYVTFDNVD